MFWLKACPKCKGDLYQGKDMYGPFIACLQCSHYLTVAEEIRVVGASFASVAQAGPTVQMDRLVA